MKRTLLPYQKRWVADKAPFKVIEKSRRIGLSWCEAYDSVMHAAEGVGNVYYQSYDKDMTAGFIGDCAEWADYLDQAVGEIVEGAFVEDGKDVKTYSIRFASGKTITAMTSAPRQFRSKGRPGDLGIIDEAAFIDDLDEVLKAAVAFLFWGGRIHVMSTHNGEANAFNQLCEDIHKGKQPGSLHKVTFDEAVADGVAVRSLEVQGKAATAAAVDEWIAQIRHTYRHNAAEELDCEPSAGAGTFLSWDVIRKCQHADAGNPELYGGEHCYLAIDVARRKHLWVATVFEPVGDVLWARQVEILQDRRFSEQRAVVRELVRHFRVVRLGVDQTGMGESFFEDLQDDHGEHMVEGILMTLPTRLAVATALLQRCEDAKIRYPDDEETELDLRSIKREGGTTGAPRLVADEKATDGHADRFWSFAIGCYLAQQGHVEFGYTPAPRRRSARVDEGPGSRGNFWRPDHSGDFRREQRGTW
ncbi:MAG: hypothetical protein F4Y03_12400 [Alphaproteobacteria bacterium]|nr:hypothetical protein [Alphaproteobacteria bacterium]